MREWVGTREACEQIGVTLRGLYRLIDEGRIPAYKMGRVIRLRSQDIEEYRHGDGSAGAAVPAKPLKPRPAGTTGVRADPDGEAAGLAELTRRMFESD